MYKKIIISFIIWKAIIYTAAFILSPLVKDNFVFIPKEHLFFTPVQSNALIRMFANFDGATYSTIARDGYLSSELGYFPFYPILIKFLSQFAVIFFGHRYYIIIAEIISNITFLLSLMLFYKISNLDKQDSLFPLLLLIVLFYPTSFYYGAAYNDSLFLFLASLTIYVAKKKHWVTAALAGSLATLTRLNGLALLFFIYAEFLLHINPVSVGALKGLTKDTLGALIRSMFPWRVMMKEKIWSVVLIPGAFMSYLIYIQLHFGSYEMLFHSMKPWDQDKLIFPLQTVWRYIKIILIYPTFKYNYWIAVVELGAVLLYCFILFYCYKRVRLSYWLFMFFSFLIPSLTGNFQGMPRYALHLYPFFLAIAFLLKGQNRLAKALYFIVSLILLITFLTLYTHGYFLA